MLFALDIHDWGLANDFWPSSFLALPMRWVPVAIIWLEHTIMRLPSWSLSPGYSSEARPSPRKIGDIFWLVKSTLFSARMNDLLLTIKIDTPWHMVTSLTTKWRRIGDIWERCLKSISTLERRRLWTAIREDVSQSLLSFCRYNRQTNQGEWTTVGHPFIHLAYAYEFRSEEVATQALNQGCTMYNALHTLLDQAPPDWSKYKTGFLAVVFESVRQDPRLDGLFREPGINNIDLLSQEQNLAVVLEKWNAWEVINPLAQLEESCDLAVLLALSNGNPRDSFDFFNVHIMTVAYALRVLWHYFPTSRRVSILEQYALFGIMTYICQLRPQFSLGWI